MGLVMQFQFVFNAFSVAWQHFWSLTAIHLTFRLLAFAVITPLIGLISALAIQLSDQKALTDQDIAAFVLSPVGALVAVLVVSLVITAFILDFTAMSVSLLISKTSPIVSLQKSFAFVVDNLLKLFLFCNGLILRVLVISAPFLAIAAYVALKNLTEFDINYYLTYWPPVFVNTVVFIGVLLFTMVGTLVFFLAGWGIALHIYLSKKTGVGPAFEESRRLLRGQRFGLVKHIVIWGGVRFVTLSILALIFSGITALVLNISSENVRFIIVLLVLSFAIWGTLLTVGTALINGALAAILLKTFAAATGNSNQKQTILASSQIPQKVSLRFIILGSAGIVVIATIFFGTYLERFQVNTSVEIIAHRGAANLRPENTMAAIEKAIDDKTDWVEIDVQESADGEIIIAHDSDFMKLANNPLKTWDATRADLDEIDIGSWFDPEYSAERTPLLTDVLRAAKGRSKVVIELKYYGYDLKLESEVIRIVEEEGMEDQVSLMSLKYPAVQKLRKMRPEWELGVLAAKAIGDVTKLDADFLALNSGQISAGLIRHAHDKGKDVYAWTVDDPIQMSSLISIGVDGIITNDPALARSVFEYTLTLTTLERLVLYVANFIDLSPLELVANDTDA